jgi:hypothetical protein
MDPQTRKVGRPAKQDMPSSKTSEYFKVYYHKHKQYMNCTCGQLVMKSSMCKHVRSERHKMFLELKLQKQSCS